MSRLPFRDRFLTPPVARAITAPSSILVAGVGASAAIATGLPLLVAPVVGLLAWAAKVLVSVPRNAPDSRIDPFTLTEPWRSAAVEALKAQVRFDQAVEATEAGPIRTRLQTIGRRIDDGIEEVGRIARRGMQLTAAQGAVDADRARKELATLERGAGGAQTTSSSIQRTVEALRSQIATADRLAALVDEARDQLQLLDARLDESVARAIELSVRVDDVEALGSVGVDVDGVVNEMEALRRALEETTQHVPRAAGS